MARVRSPNRDKAFEIYKESNGNIANREIAKILDISEKTISGWKVKDKWNDQLNGVLQKEIRSTPKEKRKKGGQPGNKNATGPPGNKNAVTTGEFETIFFDTLEKDELELVDNTPFEKMKLLKQEIQLLTVRERRMLKRIEDLKHSQEVVIDTETHGTQGDSEVSLVNYESTLNKIQNIEEALTRVQDKKQKAIDTLHKFEMDELKANIDKEKLELEKYKTLGDEDSDNNEAIQSFLKATSVSEEDIKALFDDEEGEEDGTT